MKKIFYTCFPNKDSTIHNMSTRERKRNYHQTCCKSSENNVVESEAGCGSERGVGYCSLLKDCNSSNMLSCHCSEGINTAAVIKLNHFPGKLNVRKPDLCRQRGQQYCDLQWFLSIMFLLPVSYSITYNHFPHRPIPFRELSESKIAIEKHQQEVASWLMTWVCLWLTAHRHPLSWGCFDCSLWKLQEKWQRVVGPSQRDILYHLVACPPIFAPLSKRH